AGLREGDLIKAINQQPVANVGDFRREVKKCTLQEGVLFDLLRAGKPLFISYAATPTPIRRQLIFDSPGLSLSATPPHNDNGSAFQQVAQTNAAPYQQGALPSPREQGAARKILSEGHWLGMELLPLTPGLMPLYKVPPGTRGVLIDEICLEAAEAGLLAGDVVVALNGENTPDLASFTAATRRVKDSLKAQLLVSRQGQLVELQISSENPLGFCQNESASPIQPGAISPHKNYTEACTTCHIIMQNGGQLAVDAGDLLPAPPAIRQGAVPPHRDRGTCRNCHVILP
ncbi:MAG: magnetochrome domain-containing protein, partial [Planctomycetes bacterium]|nr:magnetochrome domain-containing protein [Planctomycetota bacterium]